MYMQIVILIPLSDVNNLDFIYWNMNLKSNTAAALIWRAWFRHISINTNDSMFDGISILPGMDFLFGDLCHLLYISDHNTLWVKLREIQVPVALYYLFK